MLLVSLIATALVATSSATKLYVSSYAGTITTLNLTEANGTYSLTKLYSHNGCQPNASWVSLDAQHHNLYCLDEGTQTGYGTLNSFKINDDTGNLTQVNRMMTVDAPVNSAIYTSPNGTQLLAVAHYAAGLTTWSLDPATGSVALRQNISLKLDAPGPNKDRQATAHPHQVLFDPQNQYLVVPDLGGDIVRIYYIDPQTLLISPKPSISVVPGSGPRHGRFLKTQNNSTFYYLVTELGNTLTGYQTTYLPDNGGLNLTAVVNGTTYGPNGNRTAFAGNAASEIYVSRNQESLIVSNRNATVFNIPNPDPKNSTLVPSDAMATFSISAAGVNFSGLTPAGGSFPRHFSENQDGSLIAVGLQNSERVVIYQGTKDTGKLGTQVLAEFEGLGQVTSVVWGN